MKIAIISCSLNPNSRSRTMARHAEATLKAAGVETDFIDLQDNPLPMSGPKSVWSLPEVEGMNARLKDCGGFLMAVPIYNYTVNAAAKNLIELCGGAFEDKVVGFLCSAGGTASYMSVMGFANSLMFDFRTFIIPRFVYGLKEAVHGAEVVDEKIRARIEALALETGRVTLALQQGMGE